MRILLILFFITHQTTFAQVDCTLIKPINKNDYLNHSTKSSILDTNNFPIKRSGIIKINLGNKIINLKDNLSDAGYFEYSYAGVDKKRNWILIKGQDYNQEYYYLFNNSTNTIDTLIGFPVIYDDKLLCLESTYTDSPNYIELWKIKNKSITLQSKFTLNTCKIRPLEISLSGNKEIIIKDVKNNYWKINFL